MPHVKLLPAKNEYSEQLNLIRRYCITKSPGFAGVALLPEWFVVDPTCEEMGDQLGFTDGINIYLGTKLFDLTPETQAWIMLHEVLHVALRHPQRGLVLRKARLSRNLPWSNMVYNWAVDAIVNHSLTSVSTWAHAPSKMGFIEFSSLLPADVLSARPANRWGAEELFCYLMDNIVMPAVSKAMAANAGDGDGAAEQWGKDKLPGGGKNMLDVVMTSGVDGKALQPDSRGEARNWKGRVERAAAGEKAGGLFKQILFDMKEAGTPWRTLLRRYITHAVMPTTVINPSRPSRQNIIISAFSRFNPTEENAIVPFTPGARQKHGIQKLVVCVDTSGSIDDTLCEQFAAEIQTIRKTVGCGLTLITCDAEVHQVIEVSAQENLHAIIKKNGGFKGRGGTDFRPAVAHAEKIKGAAAIVYLTDMCGPYPTTCRKPLLWASIMEEYTKPPCGTVIHLKLPQT